MHSLKEYLKNIHPYLDDDYFQTFDEFIKKLNSISNVENKFKEEASNRPNWLKEAEETKDESGYHVYFLVVNDKEYKNNALFLGDFDGGEKPTIIVRSPE